MCVLLQAAAIDHQFHFGTIHLFILLTTSEHRFEEGKGWNRGNWREISWFGESQVKKLFRVKSRRWWLLETADKTKWARQLECRTTGTTRRTRWVIFFWLILESWPHTHSLRWLWDEVVWTKMVTSLNVKVGTAALTSSVTIFFYPYTILWQPRKKGFLY